MIRSTPTILFSIMLVCRISKLKFIVTFKDLGWDIPQNLRNYLHSIRKGKANNARVKSAPSQNTEKRCKEDDEVPEHLQPDGKPSVGGKIGLHASCVRVNLLLDVFHKPKSSYRKNVFGCSPTFVEDHRP